MSLRFPPRTGQAGVYKTGSPNYVDVSSGSATTELVTFLSRAASDSSAGDPWATDDVIGVLVKKDDTNWQVWTATWDDTNSYLLLDTVEASSGTLSDDDAVIALACPTPATLKTATEVPTMGHFVEVTGTTLTLSAAHAGKTVRFTSASAVTVTIDDALPVGFHCMLVQEGAGVVSCARSGTDTLNGGSANKSISAQWGSGYLYQATEGAWVFIV